MLDISQEAGIIQNTAKRNLTDYVLIVNEEMLKNAGIKFNEIG